MKKKKVSKPRFIIFGSLSILAIAYFISSLFTYGVEIKNLKTEEAELSHKLSSLKENADDLKITIEKLKDPEYIARFARENFSYSKEKGEYIIKLEESKKEEVIVPEKKHSYTIPIICIGGALLLIAVYIIKKR